MATCLFSSFPGSNYQSTLYLKNTKLKFDKNNPFLLEFIQPSIENFDFHFPGGEEAFIFLKRFSSVNLFQPWIDAFPQDGISFGTTTENYSTGSFVCIFGSFFYGFQFALEALTTFYLGYTVSITSGNPITTFFAYAISFVQRGPGIPDVSVQKLLIIDHNTPVCWFNTMFSYINTLQAPDNQAYTTSNARVTTGVPTCEIQVSVDVTYLGPNTIYGFGFFEAYIFRTIFNSQNVLNFLYTPNPKKRFMQPRYANCFTAWMPFSSNLTTFMNTYDKWNSTAANTLQGVNIMFGIFGVNPLFNQYMSTRQPNGTFVDVGVATYSFGNTRTALNTTFFNEIKITLPPANYYGNLGTMLVYIDLISVGVYGGQTVDSFPIQISTGTKNFFAIIQLVEIGGAQILQQGPPIPSPINYAAQWAGLYQANKTGKVRAQSIGVRTRSIWGLNIPIYSGGCLFELCFSDPKVTSNRVAIYNY